MRCEGMVVVVTGGAMGIGRAIVEGFLDQDASVVLADKSGAKEAAESLAQQGRHVVGVACDVSSAKETQAMAQAALNEFGRIDVLVNNAGIYSSLTPKPFEELEAEDWRQVPSTLAGLNSICRTSPVDFVSF